MTSISTPKYVVNFTKFKQNCEAVMTPFDREWCKNTIYGYSVKTNRDAELIKYASSKLGWYIEMVSPDEYNYCVGLGIPQSEMILNGPCKSSLIVNESLPVRYLNLDNLDEVHEFCEHGNHNINVGLRINFDLESVCPGETTAGDEVSRFGIDAEGADLDEAVKLLKEKEIYSFGIHLHTSTKSRSLGVFKALAQKAVELRARYNVEFSFVDIGGGFFGGQKIAGKPSMEEYAIAICDELKVGFDPLKTKLILEPGASVLSTCVSYETRVINVRNIRGVRVITLDGTLLHVNPFLAKRNQPFDNMYVTEDRETIDKQIVCGSTCMETDRFSVLNNEVEIKKDDILVFHNVGAYTMAFNSFFIFNPPVVEYIGE